VVCRDHRTPTTHQTTPIDKRYFQPQQQQPFRNLNEITLQVAIAFFASIYRVIIELWPVSTRLATGLAGVSPGFCNSLKNNLFGVGGEGRNRTTTGVKFLERQTAFRPRHQSTKLNSAPNTCRIRPFCAVVKHSRQLAHSGLLLAYHPSTTGSLALSLALAESFHWHFHWHQHRRA